MGDTWLDAGIHVDGFGLSGVCPETYRKGGANAGSKGSRCMMHGSNKIGLVVGLLLVMGVCVFAGPNAKKITVTGIDASWNGKKSRVVLYGNDFLTATLPDGQVQGKNAEVSNGSATYELYYAALSAKNFGDDWQDSGSYYIVLTLDVEDPPKNSNLPKAAKKMFRLGGDFNNPTFYQVSQRVTTLSAKDFVARDGLKADGAAVTAVKPAPAPAVKPAPAPAPVSSVKADPSAKGGSRASLRNNTKGLLTGKKVYVLVYASDAATAPVGWGVAVSTNRGPDMELESWSAPGTKCVLGSASGAAPGTSQSTLRVYVALLPEGNTTGNYAVDGVVWYKYPRAVGADNIRLGLGIDDFGSPIATMPPGF